MLARYWHARLVVTPTDFIGLFPGMAAQCCGMAISDIIGLPGVRRSLSSSTRREDKVVQLFPIGRVFAFASQDVGFYYRQKRLHGKVNIILTPDYPEDRHFAVYIRQNAANGEKLATTMAALQADGTVAAMMPDPAGTSTFMEDAV
ncbi:hypothetical protein CFR76_02265 [Komagataeibacter swingsii]|uniref:Uncharacterized protein n=2 Tax=Komagataeibacter swingsii TaxID=215220 RepID=A0A2V4S6K4_9PROT|nr:hypothetical protein CFR76_02265 [Komagataeibacter swingsii]GBQ61981.1 hypothetical protein AA16373_2307 [Komagataeibacter swingsii DSM 16373]